MAKINIKSVTDYIAAQPAAARPVLKRERSTIRKALPRAAYVAFTGTPLLKNEKTANKFGPIVHAYTMQRAVEDETVVPLLYEERVPELEINEEAVNRWFEKITAGAPS